MSPFASLKPGMSDQTFWETRLVRLQEATRLAVRQINGEVATPRGVVEQTANGYDRIRIVEASALR